MRKPDSVTADASTVCLRTLLMHTVTMAPRLGPCRRNLWIDQLCQDHYRPPIQTSQWRNGMPYDVVIVERWWCYSPRQLRDNDVCSLTLWCRLLPLVQL